jgi:hypothetical protein
MEPESYISRCDELLAEHGDDPDLAWREAIADSPGRKGGALAFDLGRPQEGIAAWDQLCERYANASEPRLQYHVNFALSKKALTLVELRRPREAYAVYRELMAREHPTWPPRLGALVARLILTEVWLVIKLRLQCALTKAARWSLRRWADDPTA